MAITTREARREAKSKRSRYFNSYKSEFIILFNEAIEVENLPKDLPKRYLLKILREKGGIAYDKETKLFLPFTRCGVDIYGLATYYNLIGYNGFILNRKPEEIVILRANDILYSIDEFFDIQIEKIIDLDLAIEQNLEAIKTMTIAEVNDQASLLSLVNQNEAKRVGATIVYRNKLSMQGTELKCTNTGAQYLIDKLQEARKKIINETLSRIGINVANVDKRERVQGEEIKASQGYALDCLSSLIDTFNEDAKKGNLNIRLKGRTSLYKQNKLMEEEIKKGEDNE